MREIYDVVKAKEARQGKARLKKKSRDQKKRKKMNVCPVNKAESSGKTGGVKGERDWATLLYLSIWYQSDYQSSKGRRGTKYNMINNMIYSEGKIRRESIRGGGELHLPILS